MLASGIDLNVQWAPVPACADTVRWSTNSMTCEISLNSYSISNRNCRCNPPCQREMFAMFSPLKKSGTCLTAVAGDVGKCDQNYREKPMAHAIITVPIDIPIFRCFAFINFVGLGLWMFRVKVKNYRRSELLVHFDDNNAMSSKSMLMLCHVSH